METQLDRNTPNGKAGFRKGRATRDQIANLRWLIEKAIERNRKLLLVFIDYSKGFDCVDHDTLWNILHEMGFPVHIIHLIQELYKDQSATVKTEKGLSDMFPIAKGVLQECILSPHLFNIYGCLLYTSPSPRDRG